MAEILVVDDQPTSRVILDKLSSRIEETVTVRSFADPFKALAWAASGTPDLAFVDYQMPLMDGIEFTHRFRLLPPCADVPLVVVTAHEDRRIRYRALEAGATDFLVKPIDRHEFQARSRNMLTMRRQQKIIGDRARWLEQRVDEATHAIRAREKETLLRLAKAGEYRDEVTGDHVLRMARYSRIIAREMGLPAEECETIELAAPLHDIGKIGISDRILLKRERLTRTEFEIIKTHARIGYEILKESPSRYLQTGATIALRHHERYDGAGYPDGLRGEEIPLPARIVAVADVYDAMTTPRPYKGAWTPEQVVASLLAEKGRHFDPACVDAFRAGLDRIMEARSVPADLRRGSPEAGVP